MGTVITSGIGSGLDIQGLVAQLVAAEGQPESVRLDTQEARLQSKLSAVGSLTSALDALQTSFESLADPDTFRGRTVSLSSPDFVTATATSGAAPASYAVEVQQLATAHRLVSAPFAAENTIVGTGTLTLSLGAASFSVDIDNLDEHNTLGGIRDAINESAENTGIVATIVTGVAGAQLILSGNETGAANQIVVTASGGDGGLVPLTYDPGNGITNLTELEAAVDASALIEGILVTSATNSVSDAIEGVDISLLGVNNLGETTTVTVGFDRDGAKAAVSKFVEAYNGLIDMVTDATRYDPESGTAGPLLGDTGLRNILFQLRRELGAVNAAAPGSFGTLSELGITAEFDGKLSIDDTDLEAALDSSLDGVVDFFSAAESGLAVRLDSLLEPYLQTGGVLDARRDGFNASIEAINERREALQERLVAVEARLLRQFNALDSLLAELQSTSGFLQQQLDSLPGFDALTQTRGN
ncbi:MAG: flagellar filament capping protein FliD [Gammaproteobacteria bacterium]|nr:flagellar filament capping protein FliD [Gammaproteobacteria bacterium]